MSRTSKISALVILIMAHLVSVVILVGATLIIQQDTPIQLPTIGDCSRVDWTQQDETGRLITPVDLNRDGRIDCGSDLELGA